MGHLYTMIMKEHMGHQDQDGENLQYLSLVFFKDEAGEDRRFAGNNFPSSSPGQVWTLRIFKIIILPRGLYKRGQIDPKT